MKTLFSLFANIFRSKISARATHFLSKAASLDVFGRAALVKGSRGREPGSERRPPNFSSHAEGVDDEQR
jgi:hypothetical protein